MIFELYQKMLSYKLYPTYSICTIYNKTIDRRNTMLVKNRLNSNLINKNNNSSNLQIPFKKRVSNNTNNSNETSNNNITMTSGTNANKKKTLNNFDCSNYLIDCDRTYSIIQKPTNEYRKRTLKSRFDTNPLISDHYYFHEKYPCVDCQELINLCEIGRDFKKMLKELEWAKCPFCNSTILPKLRVNYISADNPLNSESLNTSKASIKLKEEEEKKYDESEILMSPFFLKFNLNNTSFVEARLKLDVDYFKIKFNAIFWNFIWYFEIKGLPYDFFQPYYCPIEINNNDNNGNNFIGTFKHNLCIQNMSLSYTKNINENISLSFENPEPHFLIEENDKS